MPTCQDWNILLEVNLGISKYVSQAEKTQALQAEMNSNSMILISKVEQEGHSYL